MSGLILHPISSQCIGVQVLFVSHTSPQLMRWAFLASKHCPGLGPCSALQHCSSQERAGQTPSPQEGWTPPDFSSCTQHFWQQLPHRTLPLSRFCNANGINIFLNLNGVMEIVLVHLGKGIDYRIRQTWVKILALTLINSNPGQVILPWTSLSLSAK